MKRRIHPMPGFRNFGNAAITIGGMELAQKVREGHFDITEFKSGIKLPMPRVWDAVIVA